MKIGKLECNIISAGTWKGDGGAMMGVMPKALWQKIVDCDEKNRVMLAMNLLLIKTENKNILIDTGLGNDLSERVKKIYEPSTSNLLLNLQKLGIDRTDIDYVILTHLHFDHVGGVVSIFNGKQEITFPNAIHIIQKKEWETAKNPDDLNKGSYNFPEDLGLLEKQGKFKIVEGDFELVEGITVELAGGHSEGMQMVRLESAGELAYYAGDIIPIDAHRHLAVSSAYEICRRDTFAAKQKVLNELKQKKGILFLAHDINKKWLRLAE